VAEHGALAGAAGSEQRHDFATLDIEIYAIEYPTAAIADGQIADADDWSHRDYPIPSM
jgi:hypothetical protein